MKNKTEYNYDVDSAFSSRSDSASMFARFIALVHPVLKGTQILSWSGGLFALAFCSGCVSGTMKQGLNGANKPALLVATALPSYNYTDKTQTNYYLNVYDAAGSGMAADQADAERKRVRNKILNDLKGIIDNNYFDFEDGLRVDVTVKNTTADIVTLGLTAAATAAGANGVKTILSAIATGVVGVNTSLDKNIFQSNTVQALQLEMRTLRANVEVKLNHGMNDKDLDYPLQQGIVDIVEYYYSGSISDALLGLVAETGGSQKSSQAAATAARKEQVTVAAVAPNRS